MEELKVEQWEKQLGWNWARRSKQESGMGATGHEKMPCALAEMGEGLEWLTVAEGVLRLMVAKEEMSKPNRGRTD